MHGKSRGRVVSSYALNIVMRGHDDCSCCNHLAAMKENPSMKKADLECNELILVLCEEINFIGEVTFS